MTPIPNSIIDASINLANDVPASALEKVASLIDKYHGPDLRSRISDSLPHAAYRDRIMRFCDAFLGTGAEINPEQVATAIQTASRFQKLRGMEQNSEMVWTGPNPKSVAYRHTEQAILEVLNSAKERVLLVSFAVYAIPNIQEAVVRAAQRDVKIKVIVETPSEVDIKNEYSTLKALGRDVAACSKLYYWPKEKRDPNEAGRQGIMHVKCLVGDGRMLFISSANLTKYAFTQNMELGLLVSDGRIPSQIECLFEQLIDDQILLEVDS